jgi:tetratricopeptide (TPR) repeat protein
MKTHKKISVALVAIAALITCRQASAQYYQIYVPPYMPDICGGYGDEWSAKCHRDGSGNMIDGRTGDVYNKSGDFLRHGGAKNQDQPRNNNNRTYSPNPGSSNGRQRPGSDSRALATSIGKQGYDQLQRGNFKDAAQFLTMAIGLQPNWAEAHVYRGSAYGGLRDWQSALRDFNQAIRLKPNLALAYANRAWAYYNLGDLQNSLRDNNQTIRLDPNLAGAYDNRAFVLYDRGNVVGAISDWKKAISLDSRLAEPHMAAAVAAYKQGNNDDARTLRAKALQIDRRYGDLQYLKREVHWSSSILRDASAFFQNQPLANQSNSSSYQSTQSSANTKTQSEEITGVGLQFNQEKKTKKLVVLSIIEGTPAANAGILPKDVITQIDGLSTQGITVEQAVKLIRGTAGTDVTLAVLRNGQPLMFSLTRVKFITQVRNNL